MRKWCSVWMNAEVWWSWSYSTGWISRIFLPQFSSHAVMWQTVIHICYSCGLPEVHHCFFFFLLFFFFFNPSLATGEIQCTVFWVKAKQVSMKLMCIPGQWKIHQWMLFQRGKQLFIFVIFNKNVITLFWNNFACTVTSLMPFWMLNNVIQALFCFVFLANLIWLLSDNTHCSVISR